MQAYRYQPKAISLNRLSHGLASLLSPEKKLSQHDRAILISTQVKLADTSIYEGLMDVNKMLASDSQGVIPKASQGIHTDGQFNNTWVNFKGLMRRGCYHFYDPRYRPSLQVEQFVRLVKDDSGELPLVVDFEASWTGDYDGWQNLYNFLEGLKAAMPGRKIDIYTGYYYWLDHSPNPITQSASLNYFKQYDLWLAWYTTNFAIIKIPKPWDNLEFLQFTESGDGAAYGAQTNSIDLNYFVGTEDEYIAKYPFSGGNVPPPQPPPVQPPTGVNTMKGTARSNTNIKPMAGGTQIGTLLSGEYVYGDLSSGGTDLINFDHVYSKVGQRIDLGAMCKASVINLTLSNEAEPGTPPSPPPPTVGKYKLNGNLTDPNGTVVATWTDVPSD